MADVPAIIIRAAHLPESDSIRVACRERLAVLRNECPSIGHLAGTLGMGTTETKHLLTRYGLPSYEGAANQRVRKPRKRREEGAPHPPQSWCRCPWCEKARAA